MYNLPIFSKYNTEVSQLKKVMQILACAAVLAAALLIVQSPGWKRGSASSGTSISHYSNSNASSRQESAGTLPAGAPKNDSYVIREYKGHIGVFRKGEEKPFQEYETEVELLPEPDRKALKAGIVVHSMEEVEKRIEDYDA
jgi:hypothetical protein